MSEISQECQKQRHTECSIQIPKRGGPETTNCQCECHPRTPPGTFTDKSRTLEDRKCTCS
jgi:hypothetical protein